MNIHLIAVHYDKNKNVIGFRLFDSDNKQTMDQPYDAVKNVVTSNRLNIHGIEYRKSDGKLHGNNGKFDRYPILFNGALIQKSIVILNTIDDSGYTICNFKGNTGEVEKDQLVKYASTSMNIANGKLITKDESQFISAIQGSYDNISLASTQLGKRIRNNKINREYAKELKEMRTQEIRERRKRPAGLKIYNDPRLPRVITGIPAANSKMKEVDPETNMTVEEKMAYTMIAMKDVKPFYHSIFSVLKKIEATPQDNVSTMGVSVSTLYFSSQFVKDTILPYLLFVAIHEVCHIGMKHRIRRGNRDFDIWNTACDYYINAAIAQEFGLKEPGDIVEARSVLRDKGGSIDSSIKHYKIGLPPFILFNSKVSVERDTPEIIYAELVGKANSMPQDQESDEGQEQQGNQNQQSNQGQQGNHQDENQNGNNEKEDGQGQNGGESQQESQGNNSEGQEQSNSNKQGQGQGQEQGQGQGQGQEQGQGSQSGETLGEENPDTSIDNLDDFSSGKENTSKTRKPSGESNNNTNNQETGSTGNGGLNNQGNSNYDQNGQDNDRNSQNNEKGNQNGEQNNQQGNQGQDQNSQQGNQNGEFGEPYDNDDLRKSQGQDSNSGQGKQGQQPVNAEIRDDSHSQSESNSKKSRNDINEQRKKGRLVGKEFRGQSIPDVQLDMVDDKDTEGKTDDQLRQKANSILNRAVVIHKQKHKFGGDNADFLERYVEKSLAPKVNWKTLLKNRLTKATQKMNTYSAPDKRFISRNMLMPGPKMLDNDYIENIKICADTSGSITNVELGMALTQIDQLFRTFKASAELIYWDTRVRAVYPFKEVKELINKKPMGGGGTDANCVFDYFENNPDYKRRRKKKPSVIIMFTDGYIPSVNEKYKRNFRDTIWIISDSQNTFTAPFGVVAKLKYEED